MGLLDDAIREHLDLMRARGGDPAEVERMEREALGPVRREPTIGSARAEAAAEHPPGARDLAANQDHPAAFEEPGELGYHDSTAPHPHPHHEQHGYPDDRWEPESGGSYAEEPAPPRRRFLRRNRSAPDAAMSDRGFGPDQSDFDPLDPNGLGHHDPLGHDDPFAQHDAFPEHDPLAPHDALAHHDPIVQHDPLARHDPLAHIEPTSEPLAHDEPPVAADEPAAHSEPLEHPTAQAPAADSVPPPQLQFEHPPKRPRFTAEPPGLRDADAAADPPLPPDEPGEDSGVEVQETTEFDVQKHIAETRYQPDETASQTTGPAAPPAPAASAPAPPAPAASAPAPAASAPAPTAASSPPVPPAPAPSTPPAASAPSVGELPEGEAEEDVLEETPEFLQDTPEHDRLWFEQRPPKDFDFDG